MGSLAGAVAIFVFFIVVAPPFRSPEALATVLYATSTIGIMACGVALLMIGRYQPGRHQADLGPGGDAERV
jgi:simple sugar transport system permease protein